MNPLRILAFPVAAPVGGLRFVLEQIRRMAERELYDEDRMREELLLLQLQLEEGEIGEDVFRAREAELMARLREARRRRTEAGERTPGQSAEDLRV